jgi:branched-subunit amino acid ABC-type transport system permease component
VSDLSPFLVAGLASGSVYALAALGIVVTYRVSGVFNFAHGAVAVVGAFAFYSLRTDLGLPTVPALLVVVAGVGPALGLVIDRLLLRRLTGAAPASYVVASLGLLVALQGLVLAVYGAETRNAPTIFPRSTYEFGGIRVGFDQAALFVIAVAAAVVLGAFFRSTHLGLCARAVVDDADLADLARVDSRRVRSFSWMLGCAFAAFSGVLVAPFFNVDAVALVLFALYSFGAAVVGRLTSIPLTVAGGLGIGVVASLATRLAADHPGLSGLPTSVPFIVLFAVLLGSRPERFAELTRTDPRRVTAARLMGTSSWAGLAPLLAAAVAVPAFMSGSRLVTATTTLAYVLIFSSLGLVIGLARQVSLCHAVFVVFGATTLAHLTSAGVPYPLALALAGLAMVPLGAVVAVPAMRLPGLFLALATFGFGVLAQYLLYPTGLAFGRDSLARLPRPSLLVGDRAFYFFCLAVVAGGVLAVEVIRRARLGRIAQALADAPAAVGTLGIPAAATRVLIFSVAAFLAGVAGGLLATSTQTINPFSFDFFDSLLWVTVLVTAGPASLGGAVLAAGLLVVVPAVFPGVDAELQQMAFGVAAVVLAQRSNGLVGLARLDIARRADRAAWRRERSRHADRLALARGNA